MAALQAVAREIAWPENELNDIFTYGGYNFSSDTPIVSWFALAQCICLQALDGFFSQRTQSDSTMLDEGTVELCAHCDLLSRTRRGNTETTKAGQVSYYMERVGTTPSLDQKCSRQRK